MIVPDVNLLVYAFNADAPHHGEARAWWEDALTHHTPVGLPWAVSLGFVRLMTHPRVLVRPMESGRTVAIVRGWLDRRHVRVLVPGSRHLAVLERLLAAAGTAGSLTTDAHVAALAIEHQAELCSNDMDFGRFPGLRWTNPLASVA